MDKMERVSISEHVRILGIGKNPVIWCWRVEDEMQQHEDTDRAVGDAGMRVIK